jgi:sugar phosphate isomerase/epimerase
MDWHSAGVEKRHRRMTTHISRLSVNLATVREQWNLRQAVEACARLGIAAVDPWRDQVAAIGLEPSVRAIKDAGLKVSGYCRGGMFPAADTAGRQAAIDDNKRAIDEANALGAGCLVLVAGGLPKDSRDIVGARRMVEDGIAAVLPYARAHNMPLAIEPLHPMYAADRACVNTLAQALDLCEALGDGVGVAIDTYHVWWDPDLAAQIARTGSAGRILAYHICDWLVPTRDLLLDRGMMGDGVIDLPGIGAMIGKAGYRGFIEVEIFSVADWWKRPGEEVLQVCIERFDRLQSVQLGHDLEKWKAGFPTRAPSNE